MKRNIFYKNSDLGTDLFYADSRSDGRNNGEPDRHDEANIRFAQFCEKCDKF
jgi:hypothetical protein